MQISSKLNTRLFWSILLLIMLASFVIRLWGIGHGLPNIQTTDENSDLSTALRLTEGQMPRREVRYHHSFIAYVNLVSVGELFAYSTLTGRANSLSSFRELYFSDRALFTYTTRLTLIILTTLAIGITGLIGRYVNQLVGLLAAAVLAVNGFFMVNSLYALPDSLIAFSIALCMWMSMRLWHYRRNRDYLLAGLSLAIVMLSKFSGITIAICILIAHAGIVWSQSNKSWTKFGQKFVFNRGVILLIVGTIIGNIVLNPIAFLHLDDLIYEITRLNSYAYGGSFDSAQRLQVISAHIQGIVPLIWRYSVLPCVLGLVAGIRYRRSVPYWIIVGAFLLLMVTIANVSTQFYQFYYWIPWVMAMALVAGVGLESLISWLGQIKLQGLAYIAVALLLLVESTFLFKILTTKTATDTRSLALQYIQTTWPVDTRVVAGDTTTYAVPIQRDEISIQRAYSLGKAPLQSWDWWVKLPADKRSEPAYDVYGPEMQIDVKSYDALDKLMHDENIMYIVEDDYCTGTDKRPEGESDLEFPAINDELRSRWTLLETFSPFGSSDCQGNIDSRMGLAIQNVDALNNQIRSGPVIRIYRVS